MNQKNQPTPFESLRAKRSAILRLSELQVELRRAFVARLEKEKVPLGTAAAKAKVPWKSANYLVKGEHAFGPSETLKSLAAYSGRSDLFKEFEKASENLNDRVIGISILSRKAIDLAFDVHEVYLNDCPEDATYALFAAAFDDLQAVVLGILNWCVDDMRPLEDPDTRDRLETILLSDGLTQKLAATMKEYRERQAVLAAKLNQLVEKLLRGHVVRDKLAKMLNVSPSNMGYALQGKVTPVRLEELIGLVKDKLAQRENRAKSNGKPADVSTDARPATAKPKSDRPKPSDNPSMEPARKLKGLIARLRTVYGSETRLAQDLKLSIQNLHDAMNGNMSVNATLAVHERAQRLVASTFPARPMATAVPGRIGAGGQTRFRGQEDPALEAPSVSEPDQSPLAKAADSAARQTDQPSATAEAPEPISSASRNEERETAPNDPAPVPFPMGRTSEEGVPFTLDETCFRPFKYRPTIDDLEMVIRSVRLVRAHLNLLAQIEDDAIRHQVRQTMSHEVEELGMALRIFADEYPNRMISLYDAERATMRALGMDCKHTVKKNR